MATTTGPTLAEIQEARQRLHGVARETPVLSSETLGRLSGRPVSLKAENLQRTGSFKIRGAYNRISKLTDAERAARRRHRERRQPRPGRRLGRP